MRITIFTVGSHGDVQPYVALGVGLQRAGHDVVLCTHSCYERFISDHGLKFAFMPGNPLEIWDTEYGRRILKGGLKPWVLFKAMREAMEQESEAHFKACSTACEDAELVLRSLLSVAPMHIAEAQDIPCIGAYLQPFTRTRAFGLSMSFGWAMAQWLIVWLGNSIANRWRVEYLDLKPLTVCQAIGRYYQGGEPIVYGYSSSVVPRPYDWPLEVEVAGYWFLDSQPDWEPPPDLLDFLDSGPAPVCVGLAAWARATQSS